jgi:predicted site-specific integrase-resolvase
MRARNTKAQLERLQGYKSMKEVAAENVKNQQRNYVVRNSSTEVESARAEERREMREDYREQLSAKDVEIVELKEELRGTQRGVQFVDGICDAREAEIAELKEASAKDVEIYEALRTITMAKDKEIRWGLREIAELKSDVAALKGILDQLNRQKG